MAVVEVLAHTFDEISGAGIAAMLRSTPQVRLVDREFSAGTGGPRIVVLALEGAASRAAFGYLRRVQDRAGAHTAPRCVLIADQFRDEELLTAIECGVAAVLPRAEADTAGLVGAVLAVSKGAALLPGELQGALFTQFARISQDLLESHDVTFFGLAARECEVLRMIADGWAMGEISDRLGCSEGTAKNVLYGLMARLGLRSRAHAVAYAIRTGVIFGSAGPGRSGVADPAQAARAGTESMEPVVRVAVHAADPITHAGLVSCLGRRSEFGFVGGDRTGADVAVVQIDRMTPSVAARLRELHAEGPVPKVLVANGLDATDVPTAVECRVVALLPRAEATGDRLADTVLAAASGRGAMPPDLLGELLAQVRRLQSEVLAPRGLNSSGLTKREVDVLKLMADGRDTAEIAEELCYSDRTVKNIIHAMTTRLNLRNRPHAVAYAMRAGVL